MNCKICGKVASINYGDANSIICKECIGISGRDNEIKEGKEKVLIWLAKTIIAIGFLFVTINVFIFLRDLIRSEVLLTGILFNVAIGLVISTIGYTIPYIISIDKNIMELNKKFKDVKKDE